MTSLVADLNGLAGSWARLALAVTWQAVAVVAIIALIAAALRRSPPGLRYWLWQLAAIKLLLMPFWWAAVRWPDLGGRGDLAPAAHGPTDGGSGPDASGEGRPRRAEAGMPGPIPGPGSSGGTSPLGPLQWQSWLLLGWSVAVVGQVAAIGFQHRRLAIFLRRTARCEDEPLLDAVAEVSAILRLPGPPEVRISRAGGSPFVCGVFRPKLVLPGDLTDSLGPAPLRSVLLHELAHLARRDLVWDWIPAIAQVAYWFHPAAHYIASRARLERELACDRAAMLLSGQDAASYASTLVSVVSRRPTPLTMPLAPRPAVDGPISGIGS